MKKTALITGASSGIGLELAKVHAKAGDNLVLVARSEKKLNEIKENLEHTYQIKVDIMPLDLSKAENANVLYEMTQKKNIHVDYLINNAGFGDFGFFYETDLGKEMQMMELNMLTLTALTKLYLKPMMAQKYGRIMNVASTAAFQPGPLMAVYYATKHYVLAFSEAIANELQGSGVTVTALCPGPTESGFQDAAVMHESKLVKGKKLPSSAEVARYGHKAMMKGKTVAIHGMMNYIMANSVRFVPRKIVTSLVRIISGKD